MTRDIIVTAAAYAVTVTSFMAWIFIRKPERIPRTHMTAFALGLRSLPLFLAFFMVCRAFNVTALFGLVVLASIGFFSIISFNFAGLPGLAMFYAVQQWILGWPDRKLLINQTTLESSQGQTSCTDPFVGRVARVISPLRPSGRVMVDGKEVDARCEFGFLDSGTEAKIVGKNSFTFLVEPMK